MCSQRRTKARLRVVPGTAVTRTAVTGCMPAALHLTRRMGDPCNLRRRRERGIDPIALYGISPHRSACKGRRRNSFGCASSVVHLISPRQLTVWVHGQPQALVSPGQLGQSALVAQPLSSAVCCPKVPRKLKQLWDLGLPSRRSSELPSNALDEATSARLYPALAASS